MELVKQFQWVAKAMGVTYTFKGSPIVVEKAFTVDGLLPAILRRSDQLASFCLGYGLGVTFEKSNGMLGVSVMFDDKTPNALRLLCFLDVLVETGQSSPTYDTVSLDHLE